MTESKTYLNVPFAEKDVAKALGARWDAEIKKWYVPAKVECAPFVKWLVTAGSSVTITNTAKAQASSQKNPPSSKQGGVGVVTQPADKNFVAYNGDEPPWD